MHYEDMTPGVMAGLAWYYLLAAMLNAAASAYVAYMEMVSEGASREGLAPKTRRMPEWLVIGYFALYGLAVVLILGRGMLPGAVSAAYVLCALANVTVAITACADAFHFWEVHVHDVGEGEPVRASLDDHQPAVGLGPPVHRALWTLIWSIVALVFQVMGLSYLFGGPISMPQALRDAIDFVSGPTTFFVGATLGFIALIAFRRFLSSGLVAWSIVNLFLLYF